MTILASPTVTIGHDGSVTVIPDPTVPEITAAQFRAAVTAMSTPTVPATGQPPVPVSAVPCPTDSATDTYGPPEPYVTLEDWSAWLATEINRGDGWETLTDGLVLIDSGSQRALDDLVDKRVAAIQSGSGHGWVRISAATIDNRGRALVAYSETALPAAGRSKTVAAARTHNYTG